MKPEPLRSKFTEVFERENDALFRFCLWRTSNRELAIEFTQEALARLWREMQRGKNIPNYRAFIFLVAKRLIIDWYRKRKTLSLDETNENDEPLFDPGFDPSSEIDIASDGKKALASIEELDERYREVVYLRFIEDLPPRDIALTLGISANAVSVRLTRGVAQLREILGININQEHE